MRFDRYALYKYVLRILYCPFVCPLCAVKHEGVALTKRIDGCHLGEYYGKVGKYYGLPGSGL